MIDGLKRYLHTIILSTKGSIAIMFAIMIPMLLVFMAYYFDIVQLVAKQARLLDAVDEGTLAISSRGWGNDKHKENIETLRYYLENYLPAPEAITFTDLNVELREPIPPCMTRYHVSAGAKVKMFFHYDKFTSFPETEVIYAESKACLRGSISSFIGDFAFLIDLSSSMRCVMNITGNGLDTCKDDYREELQETAKLTKLKEVVTKMIVEIMETSNKSQFALVPFNIGVPVKLDGKNEKGGQLFGCSVAFVPKAGFDIDYAYWANKYIPPTASKIYDAVSYVDNARFDYYNDYVVENESDLDRYCTKNNPNYVEKNRGQALRSCMSDLNYTYINNPTVGSQEWYNNNSMLYNNAKFPNIYQCVDSSAMWTSCTESLLVPFVSRKLHPTFINEWEKSRNVREIASKLDPDTSSWEERKCPSKKPSCIKDEKDNREVFLQGQLLYRNIANDESVDYEKTLEMMFSEKSIITFAMPWVYRRNHIDEESTKKLRSYHWMCPSIPGGDPGLDKSGGIIKEPEGKVKMKESMPNASMSHYLIDLTRFCGTNRFIKGKNLGPCDSTKVDLKVIEDINVVRGVRTDTITGLLRAVPVVAKQSGNNFKSIIIVSDGADNVNLALSDKMLNQYKICDRIRDGFKKLNNEVGLYMIFTYSKDSTSNDDDDKDINKHIALWTSCVGKDNFYYADTFEKLQKAINDILGKTTSSQQFEMASFIPDDTNN